MVTISLFLVRDDDRILSEGYGGEVSRLRWYLVQTVIAGIILHYLLLIVVHVALLLVAKDPKLESWFPGEWFL